MSSHSLCAVPRALGRRRLGRFRASIACLAVLASGTGCGDVTRAGNGYSGPLAVDGSPGSSTGNVGTDAADSCHVSDVSTYVPIPYRHAVRPSGACLDADGGQNWGAFFDACLVPDNPTSVCTAFKRDPSNAACAACVLTAETDGRLGPILDYGGFVSGNVAGCIELTAPADIACASSVQALTGCELKACEANCPVTDSRSLSGRENCVNAVDGLGCNPYYTAASTCRAAEANGGPSGPCAYSGFRDFYDAVVPIFCGQRMADASTPLADAAPFDAARADASRSDGGVQPRADGGLSDGGGSAYDAGAD